MLIFYLSVILRGIIFYNIICNLFLEKKIEHISIACILKHCNIKKKKLYLFEKKQCSDCLLIKFKYIN